MEAKLKEFEWTVHTDVLGKGSFGEVYKVSHDIKNVNFAMKKLLVMVGDDDNVQSIKKEIKNHTTLEHENIVRLYGGFRFGDSYYLFMKLETGGTLDGIIKTRKFIEENKARSFILQIYKALAYIHSVGLAHRDVKPSNILLDSTGNLKLADFGISSKFRTATGVERVLTTVCGTLPYIAPEVHNKNYRGESVDVWSAGIVLFQMITGVKPWIESQEGKSKRYRNWVAKKPGHILDRIEPVFQLIQKILSPNAADRLTISQIFSDNWITTT